MEKKSLIKLTLTIAATLAFVLYLATPTYKYDITHPTNDKHHAIIQIKHQNGYTCSAFVVDENRAVTAGHCVRLTKVFMETKYKKRMENSEEIQRKTIAYLSRIERECIGPHCEGLYYDIEEKYKAEVEAYKLAKNQKPDTLKVFNMYGEDTGIIATPLFKEVKTRDHAVIDTTYITNMSFMMYSYGLMLKGMSGGPVLNEYGLVVGINSQVPGTGVMASPTLGIFNRKHLQRPTKK